MKQVLVVAHDAGGAQNVASYVKRNLGPQYYFYVAGPAVPIFAQKLPGFKNQQEFDIPQLLSQVDTVLMGTSWKSDFERSILKAAKNHPLKTIAFLDHWLNFDVRFEQDPPVLPDEIWVGDDHAYQLAKQHFADRVHLKSNPYFDDLQERYGHLTTATENDRRAVLYLCEPIAPLQGYDEFQALSQTLDYVLKQENIERFTLRLHPCEPKDKYAQICEAYASKITIEISEEPDIINDCLNADWVLGCHTIALVIAMKLGKKAYSVIPAGGKPCALPFPEIQRLFA